MRKQILIGIAAAALALCFTVGCEQPAGEPDNGGYEQQMPPSEPEQQQNQQQPGGGY